MGAMAEAPELLSRLHGKILRAACSRAGRHFEGCAVASRWLRAQGCKDKKLLKGLRSIDVTTAWNRHASETKCKEFETRMRKALAAVTVGEPEAEEDIDDASDAAVQSLTGTAEEPARQMEKLALDSDQ